MKNFEKEIADFHKSMQESVEGTVIPEDREIVKSAITDNLRTAESKYEFLKGFGKDLEKRFPNGRWITSSGSKVFINGGKVIAGLDGFNKEIDTFFDEKGKKGKSNKGNKIDLSSKPYQEIEKHSFKGKPGHTYSGKVFVDVNGKKTLLKYIPASDHDNKKEVEKRSKEIIDSWNKKSDDEKLTYLHKKSAVSTDELKKHNKEISTPKKKSESKSKGTPTLKTFEDMAKKAKSPEEFVKEIRKRTDVPAAVSKEFFDKYNPSGNLSPEQAASKMWDKINPKKDSSSKLTEEDKAYFKENKKELMEIINNDPLASVSETIKEHRKSKEAKGKKETKAEGGKLSAAEIHGVIKEAIHHIVPDAKTKISSKKDAYDIVDKISYNATPDVKDLEKKFPAFNISVDIVPSKYVGEGSKKVLNIKRKDGNGEYSVELTHLPIVSMGLNNADKKPKENGKTKAQMEKVSTGKVSQNAVVTVTDAAKRVGFETVKKYVNNPMTLRGDIAKEYKKYGSLDEVHKFLPKESEIKISKQIFEQMENYIKNRAK